MAVVNPEDGTQIPPPIGVPLDNVTAYVLDEKREQLPVGAAGELYLGGEQLARGYLGRPELTQERFVPDPFIGQPGARMYRTGDWARWLPNGELEFIGRKDDQIQIRGCRVELGEIEAFLFAHETVKQVCCVPRLVDGKPTSVVAHLVPHNGYTNLSQLLRDYLSRELPDYMVPSRFILHDRLPLTAQGKVDRAAMMALLEEDKARPSDTPSESGLEQALAALWRSLVPAAASSPPNMTFAQLGGDSLLLVKLMLSVKDLTGCQLEASTFLAQPTFDGLCKSIKSQMAQIEFQPVLTLRKHGNRSPLFFLYGLSGDIELYFGLAEAMGDDQPLYGIRSPALENLSRLPSSMEDAAREVAGFIRKIQPHGAPALVGHSWAGQLAFAVSRYLAQAEGVHCFTAVIGTEAPRRLRGPVGRILHLIQYFPPWLWDLTFDSCNRQQRILRFSGITPPNSQPPTDNGLNFSDWAARPIARHLLGLSEKYSPVPAAKVSMEVFRERFEYNPRAHPKRHWDTSHLTDGGWSRWTDGAARVHWIDGDHLSILQPPFVANLAQAIRLAHDQYLKTA
jgi:thioesterase domain-containing protein/acyl carrier protein